MDLFQAFLLGVLQGATEFLPVSSSGHLVLVPWLLRWRSPGLAFDAVVHWGTAAAVIVYFWQDWVTLISAALRPPRDAESSRDSLLWLIVLGTVPGVSAGYFLEGFFEGMFARPAAAAGFLLVTAALLIASELVGRRRRATRDLTWLDALVVGLGQALAIMPGISRSGATIAVGLARGLGRQTAARFSFLLATPLVLGAGFLKLVELAQMGSLTAQAPVLVVGFATSAAVGFGCIHLLLRYLRRRRLYPFAAYCAAAAAAFLLVTLARGG